MGSGGSIYVIAGSITGEGNLSVSGGEITNAASGGGGRIAIILNNGTDFGNVNFMAYGGDQGSSDDGAAGTIYLKKATDTYGELRIDNDGTNGDYTTLINENVTYNGSSKIYNFDLINITNNGRLEIGTSAELNLTSTTLTGDADINSKLINLK